MTKRWKQRPPGSTWGDWGDDDELGRINLLTPEKVLQGVREVEAGISFCLSLPLDYPGGTALNQRRHPPVLAPTEDMQGNPGTFYNVHMSEMGDYGDPKLRRRVGRRRGDPLAAVLDAVGLARPRRRRVRRRRRRGRGGRLLQRLPRRRRPRRAEARRGRRRRRAPLLRAPPRPGAHGLPRRAGARRPRRPGAPPRPRLARRRPDDARGDHGGRRRRRGARRHAPAPHRLRHRRSSSGTATRIPCRSTRCARTSTRATSRCSSGSPSRRSRRWSRTTTRSKGCSAGIATQSRHSFLPIHHLCLFKLGVPLGELWYLHELATWLREHDRSRFLLTAPPLRLPGAVGSPVTPVATV